MRYGKVVVQLLRQVWPVAATCGAVAGGSVLAGLGSSAVLTAVAITGALVTMLRGLAAPDTALLSSLVVLIVAGVLEPVEALSGFANRGMLTVGALFMVAAGLRETGAVSLVLRHILGLPGTEGGALRRLLPLVVTSSALLNNTAIVATLLPAVRDWGRRLGVHPSRLLLPLSYAAILGGTCTLIGTSTNLVVSGLVLDALPNHPELHALGMFEITLLGLPIALLGVAFLVVLGPHLLPRRTPAVDRTDDPRKYTMEVLVPVGSPLVGRSLVQADLRHLPGAFLMEIIRGERVLAAVDAEERLEAGDRLVFVGDLGSVVELQRRPGLAAAAEQVFKLEGSRIERIIVEAVVARSNPLVGQTIREGRFRNHYGAVVIAVARATERLGGRLGDIRLHAGDVLLLEAGRGFLEQERAGSEFYLVSSVDDARPPRTGRAGYAVAVLLGMVAAISLGGVPAVTAAFVAAALMVLGRACTMEEARRSMDLQVLVSIAAAIGLGAAMQVSGLDVALAGMARAAAGDSPILALAAIYLLTMVVTEVVTNNAAAVLAVPVALALAGDVGASPMPFVFTVMVAASASFLTPMGYQTNLMVYGPGGYHPGDYIRLGLPLALLACVTTLTLAPLFWPF